MDFGTLLSVAQKNEVNNKQPVNCYQTKFTPPKKETKHTKNLSDNIKKFLARKDEEERQKVLEVKKRKENLLALRDHKAQSRINKHLKVCKAANKSVLADAVDNENTALTIAGPSQPDEDDYGYVSQEASAFYNQLMNKYNNLPPEKPIFSDSGKRTVKDIASTKDRVKQALKQKELEDTLGHRRKRKSSCLPEKEVEPETKSDETVPKKDKGHSEKEREREKDEKPKAKKKLPPPPPMDFMQLLKLAEKKQYEPVILDVKPKPNKVEEPERLMTKKQMKEYLKEKEWRERKEQRDRNPESMKTSNATVNSNTTVKLQMNKIPKLSSGKYPDSTSDKSVTKPVASLSKKSTEKLPEKTNTAEKSSSSKHSEKNQILEERKKLEAEKKKLEEMRRSIEEEKRKLEQSKNKKLEESKSPYVSSNKLADKSRTLDKQTLSKDIKPRQFPPPDVKPRSLPSANEKSRQFPPSDVKSVKLKQNLSKDGKRVPTSNKRRIYDDDDEYDSELDDFIDDGPQEESEDYSKYISEIFGYDKSKYRDCDDEDTAMESNFSQQLKEEYVSTKIGIMEDLEDIRMEALEKKRKALSKKKVKK